MNADIPKFAMGDLIYHRTEESPGVIIGIIYRPGNSMFYQVVWQDRSTNDHYECELTSERPFFSIVDKDTA